MLNVNVKCMCTQIQKIIIKIIIINMYFYIKKFYNNSSCHKNKNFSYVLKYRKINRQ